MRAGGLDRRVVLMRRVVGGANRMGEPVEAWAPGETVWASKSDVSDGERVRAAAVGDVLTTRFGVRWSSVTRTLTTADRIACAGVEYQITGLKEIGRTEGLEITAVRVFEAQP